MCYPLKYIQQNKFCKKKVNFRSCSSTSCSCPLSGWLGKHLISQHLYFIIFKMVVIIALSS